MTIPSPIDRSRWSSPCSTIQPGSARLCPGSGGRTHPHRKPDHKNFEIGKRYRKTRDEGENAKKLAFGRIFESYFDLPNHHSSNIVVTDSDFILTERTCAKAITADVSFKTALAADFKREYKNIEFLWKQRPGVGGMIALPPVASQIPGKYLC